MRVLDIDLDYFLNRVATNISDDTETRLSCTGYKPWHENRVIKFLDNNLGLKNKKIEGRLCMHHNEALYFWKELIESNRLSVPFEVIHIDAHADMGLGYASWAFIMDELLRIPVKERSCFDKYTLYFESPYYPQIGDYLLFAHAFRWISEHTYICHYTEYGNDYVYTTLENCNEDKPFIQLSHNPNCKASDYLFDEVKRKKYYENAIFEPKVKLNIISNKNEVNYNGEFNFITFSKSPNYTPKSADFIIDIIRKYLVQI